MNEIVSRFWEDFTREQLADPGDHFVVDGNAYTRTPDQPRARFQGFGGRRFRIQRIAGGEITETRNLWHRGKVPDEFRGRIPNDSEFLPVDGFQEVAPE